MKTLGLNFLYIYVPSRPLFYNSVELYYSMCMINTQYWRYYLQTSWVMPRAHAQGVPAGGHALSKHLTPMTWCMLPNRPRADTITSISTFQVGNWRHLTGQPHPLGLRAETRPVCPSRRGLHATSPCLFSFLAIKLFFSTYSQTLCLSPCYVP